MKDSNDQFTHWQQHLETIIERTNQNIQHVARNTAEKESLEHNISNNNHDMKNNVNVHMNMMPNTIQQYPPMPPPPPQLSSYKPSTLNGSIPGAAFDGQSSSIISNSVLHHQTAADAVIRPIPKHVEDDLTKRILQSIRKVVERSIQDRFQQNQGRLDIIHDKLEALTEDFVRVQREKDTLLRSISTSDRLSRRLKSDWESHRLALNRVESMIQEEKQATKEEIDVLMQRHTHGLASMITVNQFQRAVETLSSKTRCAVERTALSVQRECQTDIASLRKESKRLQAVIEGIGKEMKETRDEYQSMLSSFEAANVMNVVGQALHSHLDVLETKATETIRSLLKNDLESAGQTFEKRCEQRLNELFDINCGTTEKSILVDNIAFVMKSIVEEKVHSYMDHFASSFLSHLEANEDAMNKFVSTLEHKNLNLNKTIDNKCSPYKEERKLLDLKVHDVISMVTVPCEDHQNNHIQATIQDFIQGQINDKIASLKMGNYNNSKSFENSNDYINDRINSMSKEIIQRLESAVTEQRSDVDKQRHLFNVLEGKVDKFEGYTKTAINSLIKEALQKSDNTMLGIIDRVNDLSDKNEKVFSSVSIVDELSKRIEALERKVLNQQKEKETLKKTYISALELETYKSSLTCEFGSKIQTTNEVSRKCEKSVAAFASTLKDAEESHNDMKCRLNTLESKSDGMNETVLNTIQSMNSLQLELSKCRKSDSVHNLMRDGYMTTISQVSQYDAKLNDLEKRLEIEISKLQEEFSSTQKNILNMNQMSTESMDFAIQDIREEIASCREKFMSSSSKRDRYNDCTQNREEKESLKEELDKNVFASLKSMENNHVNGVTSAAGSSLIKVEVLAESLEHLQADVANIGKQQKQCFDIIQEQTNTVTSNSIEVQHLQQVISQLQSNFEYTDKRTSKIIDSNMQQIPVREITLQKSTTSSFANKNEIGEESNKNKTVSSSPNYIVSESLCGQSTTYDVDFVISAFSDTEVENLDDGMKSLQNSIESTHERVILSFDDDESLAPIDDDNEIEIDRDCKSNYDSDFESDDDKHSYE